MSEVQSIARLQTRRIQRKWIGILNFTVYEIIQHYPEKVKEIGFKKETRVLLLKTDSAILND